jgi:hypothetical protein
LSATQTRPDEPAETATIGFVVPYPAEYALPLEGTGPALLRQIAETTGGETFALGEALQVADCRLKVESCEEEKAQDPKSNSVIENLTSQISNLKSEIELWPWFLLAALILWPIEIAWRRWGRLRIQ